MKNAHTNKGTKMTDRLELSNVLLEASQGDNPEVISKLLDAGAYSEHKDHNEQTSLMRAATAGQIENMRRLLDGGAQINNVDEDGWSALHHAAYRGKTNAVLFLLEKNARYDNIPIEGWSPVKLAERGGHPDTVEAIHSYFSEKTNRLIRARYRAKQMRKRV